MATKIALFMHENVVIDERDTRRVDVLRKKEGGNIGEVFQVMDVRNLETFLIQNAPVAVFRLENDGVLFSTEPLPELLVDLDPSFD